MKTLIIVLVSIVVFIVVAVLLFRFCAFLYFYFMPKEKLEEIFIKDYERLIKEGPALSDQELECLKDMSNHFKTEWSEVTCEDDDPDKEGFLIFKMGKIAYWDKAHKDAIKEIDRRIYWRKTCQ